MRILMVCLGNICRSPIAEGILKHKAALAGLDWQVDSAGTGFWHVDELPDRRSIHVAASHGIDIRDQRARQFQAADFDRFDRILVMDGQNLRDVSRLAVNPEHREKVVRILDFVYPGQERDVPDPYHDTDGFEAVFQMLDKACTALIKEATHD